CVHNSLLAAGLWMASPNSRQGRLIGSDARKLSHPQPEPHRNAFPRQNSWQSRWPGKRRWTVQNTGINWKYEISDLAKGFTVIGHQIHHLKIIEEKYYPLLNGQRRNLHPGAAGSPDKNSRRSDRLGQIWDKNCLNGVYFGSFRFPDREAATRIKC